MRLSHPFCRELFGFIRGLLPDLPHPARKRLFCLVFGILLAKSLVLSQIAAAQAGFCGGSVAEESHERRLRRIENDARLTWRQTYAPAVRRVVQWQRSRRLWLIIDESGHTDNIRVLMVSLWYRGRAIPLAWVAWRAQQPLEVSYWQQVDTVLAMVAQIVPSDLPVVVIGDRAFGNPAFTDRVAAHGWEWLVRIQGQTCFRDRQGWRGQASQVVSQPGRRWKARGELFKKQGWRPASLVALWDRHHRESLLLASSLPPSWELVQLYLRRGAIECLFRDWKSKGWQWESSQVTDLTHWPVLLVGLAWATWSPSAWATKWRTKCWLHPLGPDARRLAWPSGASSPWAASDYKRGCMARCMSLYGGNWPSSRRPTGVSRSTTTTPEPTSLPDPASVSDRLLSS